MCAQGMQRHKIGTASIATNTSQNVRQSDTDFIELTDERLARFQEALRFKTISYDDIDYNKDDLTRYVHFIIKSYPHLMNSSIVKWGGGHFRSFRIPNGSWNRVSKRSFYIALNHNEELMGVSEAYRLADIIAKQGVKELAFIVDEGMTVSEGLMPGISVPIASVGVSEKGMGNF
ncbi:hypothetical protein Btru_057713 [Bulinus truncatus]|nr:hypothetical protein Btru_057713 [Bulinus truncatus]